jgi:hypothetical protein
MTDEERDLINRMKEYIAGAMPDPTDEEFWRNDERVKEHLTWVMYNKMRFTSPDIDIQMDEKTGDAVVTVTQCLPRYVIDLSMERCSRCHAEMEYGKGLDPTKWWCPMCNHEEDR